MPVNFSGWQKGHTFWVPEWGFLLPMDRLNVIGVFIILSSAFPLIISQGKAGNRVLSM
jgi:hypothetical protein